MTPNCQATTKGRGRPQKPPIGIKRGNRYTRKADHKTSVYASHRYGRGTRLSGKSLLHAQEKAALLAEIAQLKAEKDEMKNESAAKGKRISGKSRGHAQEKAAFAAEISQLKADIDQMRKDHEDEIARLGREAMMNDDTQRRRRAALESSLRIYQAELRRSRHPCMPRSTYDRSCVKKTTT